MLMLTFAHACVAAVLAGSMLTLMLWPCASLAHALLLPRARRRIALWLSC